MSNRMDAVNTLLPKFRFPEFQDSGEWEEKQLHQIAKPVSDKASDKDNNNILTLSGEHGLVLQSDYFGKKIAGDNAERYIRIILNDFVYNDRTTKLSTYGSIKRLSKYKSGIVSPIYKCFRFGNEEIPVFWDWYFESGSHKPQLHSLVNEGARAGRFNISIEKFLSTSVWMPSPAEQQKIADCLTALDELIAAQSQKVEVLQAYKKGLMQNLFPAEGESVPRLRFPEFVSAGYWEEKLLCEYFPHIRNGFVGIATPHYVSNGIPYLQGKNIKQGQIDPSELITISNDFHQKQQKSQLRINDILMVQSGHVGECAVVNQKFAGGNCHALIILSPDKNVDSSFFVYYFYSPQGINEILKIKTGNTIEHILASAVKSIKVCVPTLPEQQRIAELLTAIDEEISAQREALAVLKVHKKGLMQGLFPSMDEVQE